MTTEARFERPYRVRFDEAGADGHLRASGFLRYAQDLAWRHSEAAGFGRQWYSAHGLTWLARAIELDILADVPYGSQLDVTTEVIGFRRVWARRLSEFRRNETDRPVALAITDWVLLNAAGRPASVPAEILGVFSTRPGDFKPVRVELPAPPADAVPVELSPRVGEIDPLGHVNNAAYLDYLDDHLVTIGERRLTRQRPRRYRADFSAAAEPGMALTSVAWPEALAWCYRLADDTGRQLCAARLEADPATWVGG